MPLRGPAGESSTAAAAREQHVGLRLKRETGSSPDGTASKSRAGTSNDSTLSLPGIRSKQQPGALQPTSPSGRHAAAAAGATAPQRSYCTALPQQQKQPAQWAPQLPPPGKAPVSPSSLAAAAAAAMQQHRQQQQQMQQQAAPQQQLLACPSSIRQASRRIGSNRTTASSFAARGRGQWQEDAPEEDPFLAQRRLHQLPGLEGVCSGPLEAAAGRRIMALPHIICRAADGSLYRMKTGHVQAMMLQRHLAQLGVTDLTEQEERLLTAGATFGASSSSSSLAMRGSSLSSTLLLRGAAVSTSGSLGAAGERSSASGALTATGMASTSSTGGKPAAAAAAGAAAASGAGSPTRAAGRSVRMSVLGMQRRSAVGAALEAHAAVDAAQAEQQHFILDDALLERISRLDLSVGNWRTQLAQQAAAAKEEKAAQKAAAAEEAAAASCGGHDHHHSSAHGRGCDSPEGRAQHTRQRHAQHVATAAAGQAVLSPGWAAVRHLVQANTANWQAQEAAARRWRQPSKPPTWEDVILMGDVYVKRRSGQGVAVYETRCAELGIIPCSQVVAQLENQLANMAHCKIGSAGAVPLAAALSAQNNIAALDLRDNGLDGKATGLIISGIITATAAHMTERARQRNICFAGQSMATIGAAMNAAAVQQPPHQFASDTYSAGIAAGDSEAGSAAGNGSGSFMKSHHARGVSVTWNEAAAGTSAAGPGSWVRSAALSGSQRGSLHVHIEEADEQYGAAGAASPGAASAMHSQFGTGSPRTLLTDASSGWTLNQITPSAVQGQQPASQRATGEGSWLGSSSCGSPAAAARSGGGPAAGAAFGWLSAGGSTGSPDRPVNSLSGDKAVVVVGGAADGEVCWLVESSTEKLAALEPDTAAGGASAAAVHLRSGLGPAGLAQEQDVGAEAQLALAELCGEASSIARASLGRRQLGQLGQLASAAGRGGSAAGAAAAACGGVMDAGDADGLDQDVDDIVSSGCAWTEAAQSQPGSALGSPARAGAAAAAAAASLSGVSSSSTSSSGQGGQQRPGAAVPPSGRALLAASRSRSSSSSNRARASLAADSGGVYSVLSELDLSQNPLGAPGAKVVAELLNPGRNPSQFLVNLNLCKCGIPEAGGLALAGALAAGNLRLRALGLSNNALGNKSAAAFGDLLEGSHTLKELDLGWNQIKAEGACGLARGLAANATLSKLVLCWNGLEAAGGIAMGDMLALNMGLKHLDLSHCRLGPEACLLLGEGLKSNVVLEVLLLASNDIGEDGARHLMTALAANTSLKFLGLNGSNLTAAVHGSTGSPADFNPASPDGTYSLDLSMAAERAVAVQLAELDGANSNATGPDLMRNITLDGKSIPSAKKADWPALLPGRGSLACSFTSASLRRPLGVMDSSKLTTLQRQLRSPSMSDRERLELVAMFAPFALFSCKQIARVVSTFSIGPERVAAASLLFTRTSDSATSLVSLTGVMSGHDLLGFREVMGWYAGYRWNQPTGHYELNMALPVHAAIAARLRDDSQGSPDGFSWINLLHDMASSCRKQPQGHGPPPDWRALIPNTGTLSLDYVSTHMPGSTTSTTVWGAPPLSAATAAAPAGAAGAGGASSSAAGAAVTRAGAAGAVAGNRSSQASNASGAAVGVRSKSSSLSGAAAGAAAAAAAAASVQSAISDQQLESLMKNQMGIQLRSTAAASLTTTVAGAAALTELAAADAAVLALRQAAAAGLLLLSSQVRVLVEAFALPPHRVEVAVLSWPVTLDRADNYWTVLYCLQGLEQSNLLQRLGPWRLLSPSHASCHWVLDLSNPGHEEVAKKLVSLAVGGGELPNFWNIRLRGVKKQVNENQNMWGMLTAESFTPFLEFDFMGPDAWTAMGRTEAELAAMQPGDKLKARAKQAARLEVLRCRQLYPYSCDGSAWQRPAWASYDSLMAPQLGKTPWVAGWDRLLRVLLRLELRSGGLSRDSSAIQEAFQAAAACQQRITVPAAAAAAAAGGSSVEAAASAAASRGGRAQAAAAAAAAAADAGRVAANQEGELCITAPELEELLRSWGYNKADTGHYLKLMEQTLQADAEGKAAARAAAAAAAAAATEAANVAGSAGDADSGVVRQAACTPKSALRNSSSRLSAAAAASFSSSPAMPSSDSSMQSAAALPTAAGTGLIASRPDTGAAAAAASTGRRLGSASAQFAAGSKGSTDSSGNTAVPAGKRASAAGNVARSASPAVAASSLSTGRRVSASDGSSAAASSSVGKGEQGAAGGSLSSAGGSSRPSSGQVSALAAKLEATYERGLTFNEFLEVVMGEPPKQMRLKDVALTVSSMLGAAGSGGLLAKLRAKQQAPAAPAPPAAGEDE